MSGSRVRTQSQIHHFQHEYEGSKVDFMFNDFHGHIFAKIRELRGITKDIYLQSMNPHSFLGKLQDHFSEGKSGSFFCPTPDGSFIIKTTEAEEAKTLQEILPAYYQYLATNPNSYIIRICGLHNVVLPDGVVIYVMVMENIFNTGGKKIHQKFDIKGSWVDRYVRKHEEDPTILGKDLNLHREMEVSEEIKTSILEQMQNDVKFLSSNGLMDYSLLLGFHYTSRFSRLPDVEFDSIQGEQMELASSRVLPKAPVLVNGGIVSQNGREVYFFGIIDILQRYNSSKKVERFIKVHMMRKDAKGVSSQPVGFYGNRFLKHMEKIIKS